jgi:hypothetical protein
MEATHHPNGATVPSYTLPVTPSPRPSVPAPFCTDVCLYSRLFGTAQNTASVSAEISQQSPNWKASFVVLTAVVKSCGLVCGYQRFGGRYCLYLHGGKGFRMRTRCFNREQYNNFKLIPQCGIFLEKIIVAQLVKKFPACTQPRHSLTTRPTKPQLDPSWAEFSSRAVMLHSCKGYCNVARLWLPLLLALQSNLFPSGFQSKPELRIQFS